MSLLLVALAGCLSSPPSGTTISASTTTPVHFEGFVENPGTRLRVEVLNPPDQDPTSASATWTGVGSTIYASSNPDEYDTDGTPYYAFSADVVLKVTSGRGATQWDDGALMRARVRNLDVRSGFVDVLDTYSGVDCMNDHPGSTVRERFLACLAPESPVVTLVHTGAVPDGGPPGALGQRFLVKKETDPGDAAAYLAAVDADPPAPPFTAGGTRNTLGQFRVHNGFTDVSGGVDGADVVSARYFNAGDLELGRDMSCRRVYACEGDAVCAGSGLSAGVDLACDVPVRVSCYVTNYGLPGAGSSTAAFADMDAEAPFATVAMESELYDLDPVAFCDPGNDAGDLISQLLTGGTPPLPANHVSFYAYGHFDEFTELPIPGLSVADRDQDGAAALVDLDSESGGKALPGVCLACHGGAATSATEVSGAQFLPFDVASFGYRSDQPLGAQQAAFYELNQMVREANGFAGATNDLITGWYAAADPADDTTWIADTDHTPAGWAGHERLYHGVVAPYCRSCHVATALPFDTFSEFQAYASLIETRVCDDHQMPHAEVTLRNFWESPRRGRGWCTTWACRPTARPDGGPVRTGCVSAAGGAAGTGTTGLVAVATPAAARPVECRCLPDVSCWSPPRLARPRCPWGAPPWVRPPRGSSSAST